MPDTDGHRQKHERSGHAPKHDSYWDWDQVARWNQECSGGKTAYAQHRGDNAKDIGVGVMVLEIVPSG